MNRTEDKNRQRKKRTRTRSQKGGRVTNLIATVLLVIVILLCVPLTVPRMFGFQVFNVITGSMEPEIPVGSIVYVESLNPENVKEDDVIAFYGDKEAGAITTHRVVENHVVSGEFITKGDANAENDPMPVSYDNLIGRVSFSMPMLGQFLALIATTKGKIAIACLIAIAVVFFIID